MASYAERLRENFKLSQNLGLSSTLAYEAGKQTAYLLSNPYPDGSVEARRFVDGWVDGRRWVK